MNTILQFIDPTIAHALGWTIIHSFWQASFIALAMSGIHSFSNNKSASFKYKVSVASMLSILLLSIITFGIYYNSSTSPGEFLATLDFTQVHLNEEIQNSTLGSIQSFFTQNIEHINFIWAIGVMIFIARFIYAYAYAKYLKKTAIFSKATELESSLEIIKKNLFINKAILIAESTKINVPLVVGHIKPIILFPIGMVNMLDISEVEAIITHELAHIKRYDYLTNLLLTLIEILFYFHPAVWWVSANVKAERENCCDDFALSQNIDKIVYAKALVKLEEIKSNGSPALAMPFSSKKHHLMNRIKRIMNMPQTQNDMREKSVATILLLSIVLLFSNQANSETVASNIVEEIIEFNVSDTIRIKGKEEMILKVKNGKFESLNVDREIQNGEIVDKIANSINENEGGDDTYTVTIQKSPSIEIIDDKIEIRGQGGVIYESEDKDVFNIKGDTIPVQSNRNSVTIRTEEDGKSVEVQKENGEITKLKIDGKVIPKSEYRNYEDELNSSVKVYGFGEENNVFKHFNDSTFSKSFGMLFDGENWREFGGNINQFLDEDVFDKLQDMEGMRFDFKHLEKDFDQLRGLEELKELEHLKGLEGLRGLEQLKEMEGLNELFEDLGITLDSAFNGMQFRFDNLNGFEDFDFFENSEDDISIFRGKNNQRGTVVERIGSMLNKDGLLKEYKSNKIEITGKHLKINGEKMPNALFEKYKNIYQEATGAPLTKKSKMIFDVDGKPSKRKMKTF